MEFDNEKKKKKKKKKKRIGRRILRNFFYELINVLFYFDLLLYYIYIYINSHLK